jgi:glutamine synthetase
VDYSVLGTSRVEPLLRDIRNEMTGAGLRVESAKGECNLGQHEIAFRYTDALTTADQHVLYKTGAKEIAARHGYSLTFMAKVNEREGNSCHIHVSFRDGDGTPVMAGDGPYGLSQAGAAVIAGIQAGLRELTLLYAPTVNSYKRYCAGSFAPTAVAWGPDNRTCALRLVGRGSSLRVECRVPGGDVNPYLAIAGLVCAAIDGVERELPLPPPVTGNAYTAPDVDRVPATLEEAAALWEGSALARAAFGKEVVDHYANMARVELAAYRSAVTDWELRRYFERFLPGVFDVHHVVNPATEQVAGSIWTRDAGRAIRVARGVQNGNLSVSSHSSVRYTAPFGGFSSPGWGGNSGLPRPRSSRRSRRCSLRRMDEMGLLT